MPDPDPVLTVIDIMGTKQRWHILRCLLVGHTRFNQIKRECRMSSAALSRTLKYLEHKGIISRINSGKAMHTEYALTDTGREFSSVINAMARLGRRVKSAPDGK
jgi:DNA-binding HxlR family transcriptional regulator